MNQDRLKDCEKSRLACSAWMDGEHELSSEELDHLAACEDCRAFVAFGQSAGDLLRVERTPVVEIATYRGPAKVWLPVAASLLGFLSVGPMLGLLKDNRPSVADTLNALHALRQSTSQNVHKDGLSAAPTVRALQILASER